MMRAGTLRHRVNFLEKVETKNIIGESEYILDDVFDKKVPVSIRELQTTEKFFDSSVLARTELILSMRYNSKINEKLIVSHLDKNYEIIKVNNIYGRNKQLILALRSFDE